MSAGRNNNRRLSDLIPGPCVINTWERNSLVLHAVAPSPLGPFTARDVALPSSHTNPQVRRATDRLRSSMLRHVHPSQLVLG